MAQPVHLVTADEFARIPDDAYRYELVDGRVIRMSPPGFRHGALATRLGVILFQHVEPHRLGVLATEAGFKLASNPDTVRSPDLAFVRRERISTAGLPAGFWAGPPDLVVEILSPDDRPSEVREKIDDYLSRGVRLVWVVDPDEKTVTIHRRLSAPVTVGIDETLDGGDVLPGFSCPVRRIFE